MIEKTLKIEGMHCKKCIAKVEAALKGIDATYVDINQDKNEALVCFENEIADAILSEAIQKVGFAVISIH